MFLIFFKESSCHNHEAVYCIYYYFLLGLFSTKILLLKLKENKVTKWCRYVCCMFTFSTVLIHVISCFCIALCDVAFILILSGLRQIPLKTNKTIPHSEDSSYTEQLWFFLANKKNILPTKNVRLQENCNTIFHQQMVSFKMAISRKRVSFYLFLKRVGQQYWKCFISKTV